MDLHRHRSQKKNTFTAATCPHLQVECRKAVSGGKVFALR